MRRWSKSSSTETSLRGLAEHPETAHVFQLDMPGQSIAGMVLKPWMSGPKHRIELQPDVSAAGRGESPAARIAAFPDAAAGQSGLLVQFVRDLDLNRSIA